MYDCSECGKEFSRLYNLERHAHTIHSALNKKTYKVHNCQYCGTIFSKSSNLRRHTKRLHVKEKHCAVEKIDTVKSHVVLKKPRKPIDSKYRTEHGNIIKKKDVYIKSPVVMKDDVPQESYNDGFFVTDMIESLQNPNIKVSQEGGYKETEIERKQKPSVERKDQCRIAFDSSNLVWNVEDGHFRAFDKKKLIKSLKKKKKKHKRYTPF